MPQDRPEREETDPGRKDFTFPSDWDTSNPDDPVPPGDDWVYDIPFGPADFIGPLPRYADDELPDD